MSALKHFSVDTSQLSGSHSLPALTLAYTVHGTLNPRGDNAIIFPTYYTGTHSDNARLIGPGRALDTDKFFIVVPNLFGNGVSSSPSNTLPPDNGADFPPITIHQNVLAQQQLLQHLRVNQVRLAIGWSMGGLQSYHWCVHHPALIENALIICATAKTSEHNIVFLEGVKAALTADPGYNRGNYHTQPPEAGLRAFGRVYAGWAYSQAFFRHQRYKDLGFDTAEALLSDWEQDHLQHDANDLLCALHTWQQADIGSHPDVDNTIDALQSIESNVWLMPCEQDLYFRHEDNRLELQHLRHGHYCGYQSDFGH
ncbi:MAG: alpha/beta fold hydrolase, partial [Pseudomonadota bacterium]